ncbi:MAG: SIMPL domain-containing protein [Bacteroidia bacterium]
MKKLILVLLFVSGVVCRNNAQQTLTIQDKIKKIEVTGSAEMEVVPDEIYIGIALQEYYDKQKTKMTIDAISKNFLTVCEKAGITKDRIEVQNMSGFDNTSWWYTKRKKEQPDLLQSTSYIIKFSVPAEVDKMVNMLDDNATNNVYVNKTSSSKETEFRKQLKIQALQNAKAKAQYLLEGVGEKAGGLLYVKEIESNDGPVFKNYAIANSMMASGGEASANEGLNFKKIKYRFEVEAHFAIQ